MPPETLPWYKSRVLLGALLSALLKVLFLSGLIGDIAPEDEDQWLEVLVLVASLVGDAIAAHARVTQKAAPTITA